jgi:hypothetical protein
MAEMANLGQHVAVAVVVAAVDSCWWVELPFLRILSRRPLYLVFGQVALGTAESR